MITIALSVKQIVWYVLSIYAFWPKSHQRPSVKDVDCQTYTSHSSGRLLSSLQSAMPVQTENSDEGGGGGGGVKNRAENSLLLQNYYVCFLCKNLDNIIRGPQRTVQNKKEAVHDPFNAASRASQQLHQVFQWPHNLSSYIHQLRDPI